MNYYILYSGFLILAGQFVEGIALVDWLNRLNNCNVMDTYAVVSISSHIIVIILSINFIFYLQFLVTATCFPLSIVACTAVLLVYYRIQQGTWSDASFFF